MLCQHTLPTQCCFWAKSRKYTAFVPLHTAKDCEPGCSVSKLLWKELIPKNQCYGWSNCASLSLPTGGAANNDFCFKDKSGGTMKTREEKNNRGEQTYILISFLLSRLDWKTLHFTLKLVHLHVQRVDHVLVGGKHIGDVWRPQLRLCWWTWIQVWINDFN